MKSGMECEVKESIRRRGELRMNTYYFSRKTLHRKRDVGQKSTWGIDVYLTMK